MNSYLKKISVEIPVSFDPEDDRWVDTIDGYNWNKTFKKDSPLEWYNPADSLQLVEPEVIRHSIGGGICETWEDLEVLNTVLANPESADFIVIPE